MIRKSKERMSDCGGETGKEGEGKEHIWAVLVDATGEAAGARV